MDAFETIHAAAIVVVVIILGGGRMIAAYLCCCIALLLLLLLFIFLGLKQRNLFFGQVIHGYFAEISAAVCLHNNKVTNLQFLRTVKEIRTPGFELDHVNRFFFNWLFFLGHFLELREWVSNVACIGRQCSGCR